MTAEELNRTLAQWENIATSLNRGVFTPPEELVAIVEAVRRLQAECEGWQELGERTIRAEADRSEIQQMYQRASDEARRYRNALTQILEGRFRYNMGDYETCARNAARLAMEKEER